MSLVREEVTMMTSSDMVERHLMPRYTIRRRMVSLLWKSLVMAKRATPLDNPSRARAMPASKKKIQSQSRFYIFMAAWFFLRGVDFKETHAPVFNDSAMRLILVLMLIMKWDSYAFLNMCFKCIESNGSFKNIEILPVLYVFFSL